MLFPFITIGLAIAFLGYVLYLIFVKKSFRDKWHSEIMPGLFILGVWTFLYFFFLK
jgi:hypothetical protein